MTTSRRQLSLPPKVFYRGESRLGGLCCIKGVSDSAVRLEHGPAKPHVLPTIAMAAYVRDIAPVASFPSLYTRVAICSGSSHLLIIVLLHLQYLEHRRAIVRRRHLSKWIRSKLLSWIGCGWALCIKAVAQVTSGCLPGANTYCPSSLKIQGLLAVVAVVRSLVWLGQGVAHARSPT